MSILWDRFEAGWIPSDDATKGRKNGLLQMDNVELDKNGALTLAGGTLLRNSGLGTVHTLYSRVISGSRKDYSANTAGVVARDTTGIISGGHATNAAFATAFDFTLIASGSQRKKDTGAALVNLGVGKPTAAPTLSSQTTITVAVGANTSTWANYVADVTGTSAASGIGRLFTLASGVGVSQTYNDPNDPFDWTKDNTGAYFESPEDVIYFSVNGFDPATDTLQFDILLVAGDASGTVVSDYYSYVARPEDITFGFYSNQIIFKIRRRQFERIGTGNQTWSTVYGWRFAYSTTTTRTTISTQGMSGSSNMFFYGSDASQNGTYEYAQMNVNNTGSYFAKSELGPVSLPITADMVSSVIAFQSPAAIDTQANEVWIYRRSYRGEGLLDQWYRIARVTNIASSPVSDLVDDQEAIRINETVNLNLVSIAASSIAADILDIVGPIQGRWYYFTTYFMYPSDINNPDLVDSTHAIRLTGNTSEKFLWARKVADAVILVGTTVDIYILTGTYITLPDYSVDIFYKGLGCKFPPITYDASEYGGLVYYLSSDGWRSFGPQGDNPLLVAPNLDRLYRGITCHGYSPAAIQINPATVRFPVLVARNKLWCFITGQDRAEVYDFIRQYWRPVTLGLGSATAAFATQDGQVLVAYPDGATRQLDYQVSKLVGSTIQTVSLLSPLFDGGIPRQRKDSYTIKVRCYGTGSLLVQVVTNTPATITAGTITLSSTVQDHFFDISTLVGVVKTYQIKLSGSVSELTVEDAAIEFDPRPLQLSYKHILPNNYGTAARKRLYGVPFTIDTLGFDTNITPVVDGTALTPMTVNSDYKKSFIFKDFPVASNDVLKGVDYEYKIASSGGLFEWFGFDQPRNIEIFPEQLLSFVIPVSDFGNANKKRLRVWPFILDPLGGEITFIPIVDGVALPLLYQRFTGSGKQTVRYQFTEDVFGVDYSGIFQSDDPFEIWQILDPTIVQVLPIAKRFDQVGPHELFKYGKIKQFDLRVQPFGGTSLPYKIYFQDSTLEGDEGVVTMVDGVEDSYIIGTPKGVAGQVMRIEFGPTEFDFHRFYLRAQVMRSGGENNTELDWVTLA